MDVGDRVVIVLQWLPVGLVALAGLVLAIVFRRRLRGATGFAIAGYLLLLFSNVGSIVWSFEQVNMFNGTDEIDFNRANTIIRTVWLLLSALELIGLSLLTAALFVGRQRPQPPPG
jgi:hypothetical protein